MPIQEERVTERGEILIVGKMIATDRRKAMDLFKKKDKKKIIKKDKTFHCTRCSKDVDKLYSWHGFHFCLDCQRELNSAKK